MGKTIMIVDDEPPARQAMRLILESEGYKVSEAKTADAAWRKMRKKRPDLLLLDVIMPGMTPKDLTEKMLADPDLDMLKILLVTAVRGSDQAARQMPNVLTTIEKPFDHNRLIREVKRAFNQGSKS